MTELTLKNMGDLVVFTSSLSQGSPLGNWSVVMNDFSVARPH